MKTTWVALVCAAVAAACSNDASRVVAFSSTLELSTGAARTWTPVDLGYDPGYYGTIPSAISNSGTIAGSSYQPFGASAPWVLRPGGIWRHFKPLPGDSGAYPSGINSHGLASGTSQTGVFGPYRPVFWFGDVTAQAVPGITSGQTYEVSESGWIVGDSYAPQFLGFRYRPGGTVEFLQPDTSYPFTKAYSINDAGFVAGESYGPVVWTPSGKVLRIPVPPGYFSGAATHINNRGDVVGYFTSTTVPWTGFVKYRGGVVQLLQLPPGMTRSNPSSVDSRGAVYGYATQGDGYPITDFIWENGIPMAVPQSPGFHAYVSNVNECGVMVGYGFDGARYHAIKWNTSC